MAVRGAQKKYTEKTLRKAVEKYFATITRQKTVTEPVPTGQFDRYGHPICEYVPVVNGLGEEVKVTEYLVPPSKGALAIALGIHRSTWDNYHDPEKYPEFQDIVTWADDRIHAWNEEQVLTRSGRDVKGIIFNLENNYGYNRAKDDKTAADDGKPHGIILMPAIGQLEMPPEDA